jgi:hypothetical protein
MRQTLAELILYMRHLGGQDWWWDMDSTLLEESRSVGIARVSGFGHSPTNIAFIYEHEEKVLMHVSLLHGLRKAQVDLACWNPLQECLFRLWPLSYALED